MTVGGSLAAMWAASAGLRIPSLPETGRSPQGPYTKYSPFLTHGPGVAFSASARRARRDPVVQSESNIGYLLSQPIVLIKRLEILNWILVRIGLSCPLKPFSQNFTMYFVPTREPLHLFPTAYSFCFASTAQRKGATYTANTACPFIIQGRIRQRVFFDILPYSPFRPVKNRFVYSFSLICTNAPSYCSLIRFLRPKAKDALFMRVFLF